jgi:Flp pilus assembly protein TadB
MSGAISATTVMAAAAVAGTAYSVYQGERASKEQNKAQKEARQRAQQQRNQAEQDANRMNRRGPNAQGMMDAAQQSSRGGASGTMLTGTQGVDPNSLSLGRNTLLGG